MRQMQNNMGYCDMSRQELKIASDVPQDGKESTLLHEIIEALNYHMELGLEHRQISSLETGLHQVLSDNGVDLSVLFKENKKKVG